MRRPVSRRGWARLASPLLGLVPVLVAVGWLAWGPAGVGAVDTSVHGVPRQVTVRFEGGLASANYAEVMASLGRRGLLPLEAYVDRDGLTPAEILARTGRLVGPTVGRPLDLYLCVDNKQACSVRGEGPSARTVWRNVRAPATAAGPEAGCPDQSFPPYVLCLPEVRVREYKTSVVVPYDAKVERLREIVVTRAGGCAELNEDCKRVIREMNRFQAAGGDVFSERFAGKIRLPVQAYAVTFAVTSVDRLDKIARAVDDAIARLDSQHGLTLDHPSVSYTVPSPVKAQSQPVDASQPEPVRDYLGPLAAMQYPYLVPRDFPDNRLARVVVGIWDFHVDADHCDLALVGPDGRAMGHFDPLAPDPEHDPLQPRRATDCAATRDPLEERWDHGTHVAGIIAARLNGRGIAGVNPKALLWAYELDGEGLRLENDDDPIVRLYEVGSPRPVVVNISFSIPAQRYESRLEALIKAKRDAVLFVAAAGNDGKNVPDVDSCRVIPACLAAGTRSGDGIISVVALDRDGKDRLKGAVSSNYGMAFDVGAVGEAVSALHGNFFGRMAGTSIATPYVTGLASLIYAKAARLQPELVLSPREVKERILYTADFTDTLDDVVRFGRVNFARALGLPDDVVTLKGGEPRPRDLRRALDEVTVAEGLREGEPFRSLSLKVRDLRRIAAKDETPGSRYWLVYVDEANTLRKIQEARFEPGAVLRFRDGANTPVANLKDFTCGTPCTDRR